ncbi:efflux RND transporter periplasmic adaptor subunit [bacterium]|nr:MAG: efflux RND transporter periplasmic adaptor subunit [bacterium]
MRTVNLHMPSVAVLLALCFMVGLAACGKSGSDASPELPPSQDLPEIKSTNISIQKLVPETVEEIFTLPGTLEAWENLTLSLEQSGPIAWIGPREGNKVKAGQAILRIDQDTLKSNLARDQIDYDLKKKHLERLQQLLDEKLVSQKAYDDALQGAEIARANLTLSRIAIEKSTLVSPISGILDDLLVDRGEYGTVGTPAAVVVQVDRLKVMVDIPEKDVTVTRVGNKVKVLTAEVRGRDASGRKGEVIHVSYRANEMTRTYLAKVAIDNRDGLLRPGMIVRVRFVRRVLEDVLTIPLYAVIDRDGEKFVFVTENDTAVERQVRLGPIINGKVVIFGGIQKGEDLVIKGQQLLTDGSPVTIVEG